MYILMQQFYAKTKDKRPVKVMRLQKKSTYMECDNFYTNLLLIVNTITRIHQSTSNYLNKYRNSIAAIFVIFMTIIMMTESEITTTTARISISTQATAAAVEECKSLLTAYRINVFADDDSRYDHINWIINTLKTCTEEKEDLKVNFTICEEAVANLSLKLSDSNMKLVEMEPLHLTIERLQGELKRVNEEYKRHTERGKVCKG